jgi:hypothetical protein
LRNDLSKLPVKVVEGDLVGKNGGDKEIGIVLGLTPHDICFFAVLSGLEKISKIVRDQGLVDRGAKGGHGQDPVVFGNLHEDVHGLDFCSHQLASGLTLCTDNVRRVAAQVVHYHLGEIVGILGAQERSS